MLCQPSDSQPELYHLDRGSNIDPFIEIDHVLVAHADAARRHRTADCPWLVGAVDAVFGGADIERAGAERVLHAAGQIGRQIAALGGLALDHFRRWAPVRPLALVGDLVRARPFEAW